MAEQLRRKERECEQLADAYDKSVYEAGEKQKKQTALEEKLDRLQSQMKQLNHEVETKSDLVRVFLFLFFHLRYRKEQWQLIG